MRHDELGCDRVPTLVSADDPVARAGLVAQLRSRHDVVVVEHAPEALAAIVVSASVDAGTLESVRELTATGVPHVFVVATSLDDAGADLAVSSGARAALRRVDASPDRLAALVVAEAAAPAPPPAREQHRLPAPRAGGPPGERAAVRLRAREVEVLRLVADGLGTAEIAGRLGCSERTVKSVIHEVTERFGLRNRCHAVAFAVRSGAI